MLLRTALLAVATFLVATAPAGAADAQLTIRGAGYGHGVGMSQYGALGFAQQGSSHRSILAHYYSGTSIGALEAGRTVRVLVHSARGAASFSGATRAGGRRLHADRTYAARARGAGEVDLLSPTGRRLLTVAAPLRATSRAPIALRGKGTYRGSLEFRPADAGVNVINAVGLEAYLQGVVPVESPSSWPLEALKAQAVAARTYAVTTSKGGAGFDQYADTRSQVYGGVGVEKPSTNEAVSQTRGQVVSYEGRPVVTYFFSTSGGRTENVENTSLGSRPLPWLKSVSDPYDAVSPRHRWGPITMDLTQARRKLGDLVQGSLRGIEVVRRGVSPRVVAADVVGSRGRTRVTGAQLRARLGLLDTWAYFTTISTDEEESPDVEAEDEAEPSRSRFARSSLTGHVLRDRGSGGKVTVEIRTLVGWRRAGTTRIRRDGSYRFGLCTKGAYRVRVGAARGPIVRF